MDDEHVPEPIGPFADPMLHVDAVPQRALLRMLASSHRRGLIEPKLVASLASEYSGETARRIDQLASLMSQGVPVVEALGRTPSVLDPSTMMALHLAEKDGRVSEMYQTLLHSRPGLSQELGLSHESPENELIRSTVGIIFAFLILTFLTIFVMPTFSKMFEEFGLELPAFTLLLFVTAPYVPMMFLTFLVLVFVYCIFNFNAVLWTLLSRFRPLAWRQRLVPQRIKLLSLLAIAARSSESIDTGIAILADLHPNARIRVQLQKVMSRIRDGQNAFPALAAERLLAKKESAALTLTRSISARVWLLQWFAARRWERSQVWAPLFARTLSAISTLFLGLIVAWTAVGVMAALTSLIAGLT